jgi:predicted lipid-binding transport protein (Tim44 family)
MSDMPGKQNARAELIGDPNPGRGPANPERLQPDPTLQPDHTVSGWTLAAATILGLFVLTLVFYGLNNNETTTTVASTGGASAPANQNASAQNPQDQAKTSASQPAASSASMPSQQDKNAANQPSPSPPGAAAKPQAPNSGQAPAAQNGDTKSTNTGGTAPTPPKS